MDFMFAASGRGARQAAGLDQRPAVHRRGVRGLRHLPIGLVRNGHRRPVQALPARHRAVRVVRVPPRLRGAQVRHRVPAAAHARGEGPRRAADDGRAAVDRGDEARALRLLQPYTTSRSPRSSPPRSSRRTTTVGPSRTTLPSTVGDPTLLPQTRVHRPRATALAPLRSGDLGGRPRGSSTAPCVARSTERSNALAAAFSLPRSGGAALFVLESMAAPASTRSRRILWLVVTGPLCSQYGVGGRARAVAGPA